jgi:hypothetical protein
MINRAQERCTKRCTSSSDIDIIDEETESDETPPVKKMLRSTHTRKNLTTCQQDVFATDL